MAVENYPNHKTCGECHHYHAHKNEPRGYCYGLPPNPQRNGEPRPTVSRNERDCGMFKDGTPTEHGKVNPETPGHAAAAKHEESKLPESVAGKKKR